MSRVLLLSHRKFAVISGCAICGAAAVVIAEQATVQRPKALVQDMKGSAGEVIETVPQNGTLEVLSRDGVWARVRTASGKEGYVSAAVFEKNAGIDLTGLSGDSGPTRTEAGAAGRGWDHEVEMYASSKSLDRRGLQRMEEMREACRGKALRDFLAEGRLDATH